MAYPKYIKRGIPLRPIVSSRGSISYEVAKELARILKPLVGSSPHHIKKHRGFHRADQTCHTPGRWNHHFIWCLSTVHVSVNRSCNQHHAKKIGTGPGTPFNNQHEGRAYHQPTGVLPEDNLFPVPGQLLWADQWSSHGVTHQPHSGQPLHGRLWAKSHPNCQEPSQNVEEVCGWQLCHLEFYK